jgi:tRNA pseudouridine38-40 synthase
VADVRADTRLAPHSAAITDRRVFRLVLSYDGTDFRGWQVQPDAPTVQGALLDAAQRFLGPEPRVIGASRTDAGVHALRQTASLAIAAPLDAAAVRGALNAALPSSIRVLSVTEAEPGFDARRAALGKRYAYLVDNGAVAAPLWRRVAWHVPASLDVAAMRSALGALRGRHDFSAFCAAAGAAVPPVCTVQAIHVVRRHQRVALLISADRFLHHMVRNIVGSAMEVGRGVQSVEWLGAVLASRQRTQAGPTAPAHGLVLVRVRYRG